jgi:hypothetical protein
MTEVNVFAWETNETTVKDLKEEDWEMDEDGNPIKTKKVLKKYSIGYDQVPAWGEPKFAGCPGFRGFAFDPAGLIIDNVIINSEGTRTATESPGLEQGFTFGSGRGRRGGGSTAASSSLQGAISFNETAVFQGIPAGLGDGMAMSLDWQKTVMTPELRGLLNKIDSEGAYGGVYSKYAGYEGQIEYMWVPTFAEGVKNVGGWFWYAMKKVIESDCGCTLVGAGVDGISHFLGMARSKFELEEWAPEAVNIIKATEVTIKYNEKKLDTELEGAENNQQRQVFSPDECCDKMTDACEKDLCYDPILAKPSMLEIDHKPIGDYRGWALSKLFIDGAGGPDENCGSDLYQYACRDFNIGYQIGEDQPIFEYYDYLDLDGPEGGEIGQYCHKGYIPIFGNTNGELGRMACGHKFMAPARKRQDRRDDSINIDIFGVGKANECDWEPSVILNLMGETKASDGTDSVAPIPHLFVAETEGQVCHPTGYKDIECQCNEDYEGRVRNTYLPSPLWNEFFCPDWFSDLEKIDKSITQTHVVPSLAPPDSQKYCYTIIRDADIPLDDARFVTNVYTLETNDQGGPEYDKKYIHDTCSTKPIEEIEAVIGDTNYINYNVDCEASGIVVPGKGAGPESTRGDCLEFKYSRFNRGYLKYSMPTQPSDALETIVTESDFCECPDIYGYGGDGEDCEDKPVTRDDFTWYKTEAEINIKGETIKLTSQKEKTCIASDRSALENYPDDDSCKAVCGVSAKKKVLTYDVYIPISLTDKNGDPVPEMREEKGPFFYYLIDGDYGETGYYFDGGDNNPMEVEAPEKIEFYAGECVAFTKTTKLYTYDPQALEDGGEYPEVTTTTETHYLKIPKALNAYDIRLTVTQDHLDKDLVCCSPIGSNVSRTWPSEEILTALGPSGEIIGEAPSFVSETLVDNTTPCSGDCP